MSRVCIKAERHRKEPRRILENGKKDKDVFKWNFLHQKMLHPHTRKFLLLIFNCLRKVKTFKVKKSTEKNTITTPVNPPPTVLEKTETITMKRPRLSAHRGNCDPPLSYLCYPYPIIATNKTQGFNCTKWHPTINPDPAMLFCTQFDVLDVRLCQNIQTRFIF